MCRNTVGLRNHVMSVKFINPLRVLVYYVSIVKYTRILYFYGGYIVLVSNISIEHFNLV